MIDIKHLSFDTDEATFQWWSDLDYCVRDATDFTAKMMGFSDRHGIEGHSYYDMPNEKEENIEQFIKHHHIAVDTKTVWQGFETACWDGDQQVLGFTTKIPVVNNGTIVGIYGIGKLVTDGTQQRLMNYIKQQNAQLSIGNYRINGVSLTCRESECLFLLLQGKTSRIAGETLGLSKRTIESYIDTIKNKLQCNSRQALVELAISQGLLLIIPPSMVNSSLGQLLDD